MTVLHLTDDKFQKEVLDEKGVVLVDFWATWCPPCRMLGPIIEEVAGEVGNKYKIAKVDVDKAAGTASKYGIMSVPTMVVFKNGQEMERLVGARPKEEIIETLKKYNK